MAWTDYTNGLFTLDDFNIDRVEYGTDDNDELGPSNSSGKLYIVGPTWAAGNDYLEGNDGNDTLSGYSGNDVLVGVDPDYHDAGKGEYDRLNGGSGYDLFVLGDSQEAYYLENGFAVIEDFNQAYDMLAVHGDPSDYTFSTGSDVNGGDANDTILMYQGDWIAILEDTTVNLSVNDFIFV